MTRIESLSNDSSVLSYYEANQSKLKLVAIDSGDGKPVRPTLDLIRAGKYHPLSRPLFIYVNAESAKRPEVRAFVDFYLANAQKIVEHPKVNYVAMPNALYEFDKKRFADGITGSVMATAPPGTTDLIELYKKP